MLLILIWIILITLGLLHNENKKIAFINILFASIMIAIAKDIPDQSDYISNFNSIMGHFSRVFSGNIFFNLALYIFGFFNSYRLAIFIISFLVYSIVYMSIRNYTDNVALVFSLYLISPFVIDIVQVRNFVAMGIWTYFVQYLYRAYMKEDVSRNLIKYTLGVLICTLFHFSFIVMIVFSIIPILNIKRTVILGCVSIIIGTFFSYSSLIKKTIKIFSYFNMGIAQLIVKKFNDYVINMNLENMYARFQVTLIFYIISVFLMYIVHKLADSKLTSFALILTIISCFIFIFMPFSQEIYRVQRNILLFQYITLASCAKKKLITRSAILNVNTGIYLLIGLGLASYYLYVETIYWNFESVFIPVFRL